MFRKEFEELRIWKESGNRKPLIIKGARQVGKTWLMMEFGHTSYEKVAYVNFESSPVIRQLFEQDFEMARILTGIEIESGVKPEPGNTLIIFDEIQESPKALTSLKYFAENAPAFHVMAAGSLLGILLKKGGSFPVGKVSFMDLYPLSFSEYLTAVSEDALVNTIGMLDWNMMSMFREKLIRRLKEYFFIGGMPEAVQTFANTGSLPSVRVVQKEILSAYEQDFSKHAPPEQIPRIRMVWNGIPAQFAKENRKYIYGLLKDGARAKEFELALLWLKDSGLIYKVHQISKPGIPLKAYEDPSAFKLFTLDTGLLSALANIDASVILEGSSLFEEFKGALTEQYVLQQLLSKKKGDVYYYSVAKGQTEIDFVINAGKHVIPIEVKAAENLHAKSLRTYCQKYKPAIAIRTSLSDYRKESWMINWPLYAIEKIWDNGS